MAAMGAISDVTSEFKQAGPKEKTVIIIGVIAVAGVAYYLYSRRQASATQQGVLNARSGTETPQPTGYPETSKQVPTIPGGVSPLYDPAGNLIAFQNPVPGDTNVTPPATSPPPSSLPLPPNWYTNLLGKVPAGRKISYGGIDQYGERYWYSPTQFFYAPQGSSVAYGGNGRIWLNLANKPANQQGLLLSTNPPPKKT